VEYGFLNAMFDSQVALVRALRADLVIVGKLKYTMTVDNPVSRRRTAQALAVDGVAAAYPVYIQSRAFLWRSPADGRRRLIRVVAFDPAAAALDDPEIEATQALLRYPETVLIDRKSKAFLGQAEVGTVSELAAHRVKVVGTFALGTDFVNDGTLITSIRNFVALFPGTPPAQAVLRGVEVVLLRLDPGADLHAVAATLGEVLPADARVLSKAEFLSEELGYWRDSTPIGFMFGLGTLMGFMVGTIVCYQILYTVVVDYLPQYGVLKAMGYDNRYLRAVVLRQAVLLALVGFLPGLLLAGLLYAWIGALTGLPMGLTLGRAVVVLGLTVGMCLLAGAVAMRRALAADPAEVFK
jgi:putative ABC transport system permease protein